jgi:hypothetical protein
MKFTGAGLVAALVVAAGAGCKQWEPIPGAPSRPPAVAADTVARVHWLGRTRLDAAAGASSFLDIWRLPQSERLEAQTLDKFSLALWRLLRGEAAVTNAQAARMRPLLDDLVREESYLEIRRPTHRSTELAFAIRLTGERAALWNDNLAAALESLSGARGEVSRDGRRRWSLTPTQAPNLIEWVRVDEWTVLGAAQGQNALLGEFIARIRRQHAPFAARATHNWLEADLDLRRLAEALSPARPWPGNLPKISLAVTSDGKNVRTSGELRFPKPLAMELERWNLPTNLVQEPLESFTALRGIRPWLASLKAWTDLQLPTPPNQVFFWSQAGSQLQSFFAAPLPEASNQVFALTRRLSPKINPWIDTHSAGRIEWSSDVNGATWSGIPMLSPCLRPVRNTEGSFVLGGFTAVPLTNGPPPPELLREFLTRTNLVGYSWEITEAHLQSSIYVSQSSRVMLDLAQVPVDSASLAWFNAIIKRLGNCVTEVTRTGPAQLSFTRQSTIGFTAVELNLLADWLESPKFPRGLHTLLATPDVRP